MASTLQSLQPPQPSKTQSARSPKKTAKENCQQGYLLKPVSVSKPLPFQSYVVFLAFSSISMQTQALQNYSHIWLQFLRLASRIIDVRSMCNLAICTKMSGKPVRRGLNKRNCNRYLDCFSEEIAKTFLGRKCPLFGLHFCNSFSWRTGMKQFQGSLQKFLSLEGILQKRPPFPKYDFQEPYFFNFPF